MQHGEINIDIEFSSACGEGAKTLAHLRQREMTISVMPSLFGKTWCRLWRAPKALLLLAPFMMMMDLHLQKGR